MHIPHPGAAGKARAQAREGRATATPRAARALAWLVLGLAPLWLFPALQATPGRGLAESGVDALCTGCLAAAILLSLRGARRASDAAALLAACTGAAVLAVRLLGSEQHAAGAGAGFLSPLPAFGLVLLGTAWMAFNRSAASTLAGDVGRACAATAILLGAATALPHGVFPPWLGAGWSGATGAALACTSLLACATLLVAQGHRPPGRRQPIDLYAAWCPPLLAAFVLVGWSHLEERERQERARDAALARDSIVEDLHGRLKLHADALQRLAERWPAGDPRARPGWERDAHRYLRDFVALHAVLYADARHIARWRVGRPGSPDLVGVWIGGDDDRLSAFNDAARTRRVRLTPVLDLRSGGKGLVYIAPVFDGAQLKGYMTASMRVNDLLQIARTPALRDFAVRLRDSHHLVAAETVGSSPAFESLLQRHAFDALGQRWTLEVWPREEYMLRTRSRLPETVFLLGALAVALVSAALVQSRRSMRNFASAQGFAAQLTTTLETITEAFVTLDRNWRITYVNAEAERLLGRDRRTLLGRCVWEEFPAAVGTAFQRHYEHALAERTVVAFEEHSPVLGLWLGVRVYPSQEGLAVYFQDVTQARRARDALRESERELLALAESMPQMVWMAQPDGQATYFNRRWMEYAGLPLEQSRGYGWVRCLHPEDQDAMRRTWLRNIASQREFSLECRLRRHDGAYRWMLVRAVPFHGAAGHAVKWMGTCTDIHDIRLSTEAVRLSEERLRLLSKASNDAIWDCDLASGSMWCSDTFLELFGREPADGEPSFEAWSRRIHAEDRAGTLAALQQTMAADADVWSAEYRFRRSGGDWAHVLHRGYVIRDGAGRPRRLLSGMSDITQRVQLEQKLRQSQQLESVGKLTGGVAHDFNNLLTVILGNAEVLADALEGQDDLAQLARMVTSAAERGADLTQRLLAFGRKQALAPVPLDLQAQFAELEPLLRRTLGAHIEIAIRLPSQRWYAMVDPAQFDNALLNLCLNARDAMPHGGRLTIEVAHTTLTELHRSRHPDLSPGQYLIVCVSDTGTGIAPEHMERLFEPFFTTKELGKGTGLGLPMVYGFIRQSGGQLEVASEPGQGATFRLYLPRAGGEPAPRTEPPSSPVATGRECILVVEDDPLVRTYACGQLRSLGYTVVAASCAREALDVLQGPTEVDLLFTDVVMPGVSGPRLAARALQLRPGLKVVYTTGYADHAAVHGNSLPAGAQPLMKPYSRAELAQCVSLALRRSA